MTISKDQLENRAYTSDATAFNLRLGGKSHPEQRDCPMDVPPATQVNPDGTVTFRFYAPNAASVEVGHMREEPTPMVKGEDGVWTATLSFPFPGMKEIRWRVDGVDVMSPFAPIAFGFGRPVNYVDIPCPEQDYLMIRDVPHGSVVREYYKSTVTGQWESCLVYLPPQYYTEPERRFPVLYLQHGGGENENCWIYEGKTNFIMDNLLSEDKAVPAIIVMNNGMVQMPDGNGGWQVDSERLQDLLTEECIPFIDGRYRTLTDAWNRAYAGLSMGSLQGGRLFMERRDLFASAGLFTGFRYPPFRSNETQDFLHAMDDVEAFNKTVRLFFIAVGKNEESLTKVEGEDRFLTEQGIHHVFRAYPGDHEWHTWRACIHEYLQLLFR